MTKSAGNCGLVTITEEILNRKLNFLCTVSTFFHSNLDNPLSKEKDFFQNIIRKYSSASFLI